MAQDSASWLADLDRDGYVVIPNVIPKEACKEYQEGALNWLEGFGRGFKRDDVSTWKTENLPRHHFGGMYSCHGVNHASWVWNIRAQPGIQEVFKKVWGTDDIIASFDAANITLPVNPQKRTDISAHAPWPHIDQNPYLVHQRQEVQGIANLYPSGPDDGGLIVVKGAPRLHKQYFKEKGKYQETFEDGKPPDAPGSFDAEELEWYLAHGAEIVKVCANEGDLILWDSRTIHWNCLPTGKEIRYAIYVAYAPRSWMTEDELQKKLETFRARIGTGHKAAQNPLEKRTKQVFDLDLEDGAKEVPVRPRDDPKETPEILWAVGVRS